jgi:hypothetical protein
MLKALLALALVCASNQANAEFRVATFVDATGSELFLGIQDAVESKNACDYHVRRFEYVAALKSLVIELGQEPCFEDRVGKRKATLKWTLPASLRGPSELCVVVDSGKVGSVVLAPGAKAEFRDGACKGVE